MKKYIALILCLALCLSLCACKSKAVKETEAAIEAIGTVTLDSGNAIENAENLYNALTPEDKEAVEILPLLKDARREYNELCVANAEDKIDAIGEVTIDSGDVIAEAREAYDALDSDLQSKVENYSTLENAENRYEAVLYLDSQIVKEFIPIDASSLNNFEETASVWYSDADARATLLIIFLVEGMTDDTFDLDCTSLAQQYVAIYGAENRVDLFMPYNDQILTIQYWPDAGTAQYGFATTDLDIVAYLDLMVEGGIIDEYGQISIYNISRVLSYIG